MRKRGAVVPILAKEYPHLLDFSTYKLRINEKIQKRENINSHPKVCMEDIHSIICSI